MFQKMDQQMLWVLFQQIFIKQGVNWKTYYQAFNTKMENKEFQKVCIKKSACYYYYYYFNDITKFEDFDFDNLIDEKLHENLLIYKVSYKNLITLI